MRRICRNIILVASIILVAGMYGYGLAGKYVVPIITYHNVEQEEHLDRLHDITAANLDRQMAFLKTWKYHVISLDELVAAIKANKPLAHNSIVITFDDGYDDNYTLAFPILKKYGFPATFFVITEKIGEPGYMTWDQAREMADNGMTIASHGVSWGDHYLPGLSQSQLAREIRESKRIIEAKMGRRVDHFCYPRGGFAPEIKLLVKEAGYLSACTTNRGYDRFNRDPYELKRVRLNSRDKSPIVLWGKMSGYYNLFRKPVKPF